MDALASSRDRNKRHEHMMTDAVRGGSSSANAIFGRLRVWRPLLLLVVLPTLLTAAFEYFVAANQYESEAHFIVRSNEQSGAALGSGLGQILGINPPAQSEAHSIGDYLLSHDAVAAVDKQIDLPTVFRRPEADIFSRLGSDRPAPEALLKYYRKQISVSYSTDTGITTLNVRAFRPTDAEALAQALLQLGEAKVNTFNQRALNNTLGVARRQLDEAEADASLAQNNVTGLRQEQRDIDPARSSAAGITMATGLEGQLAQARAQLATMGRAVVPTSPQYVAMASQVRALSAQVDSERSRLAGSSGSMAPALGAYEGLQLHQQFAAKRYEFAATALATARATAMKQQLFVVRVVEPNLPERSLYPHRSKIVATVFFALLVAYAIGWLILAGVREHAA